MPLRSLLSVLVTSFLLSSCGGSSLSLSEGGIGGSGFSVGKITAFGSIWVNGVRYDVSQANFTRDGTAVIGQDEYRIGETVKIGGTVNADGVSGIATSVDFKNAIEGTVAASSNDGVSILVMGQLVFTDTLTTFYGFSMLTDLQYDNVVEVSGNYDANGILKATSITLKQSSFLPGESVLEVKGTISNIDLSAKTFILDQLQIDYSVATLDLPSAVPLDGQYVEVKSLQALQGNILIASKVELEDESYQFSEGEEVELEGLVTSFIDNNHFSVNGQAVLTNINTEFEHGTAADIILNALIEVEGEVDINGILIAEEVSLKQSSSTNAIELEGFITALNETNKALVVNEITVLVDSSASIKDEISDSEISIQFIDLQVNDFIEVKGTQLSEDRVLALKIERELPDGDD